jgi:hypothetical protein
MHQDLRHPGFNIRLVKEGRRKSKGSRRSSLKCDTCQKKIDAERSNITKKTVK